MRCTPQQALHALSVAFATNSIAYAVAESVEFRSLLSTLGWPGMLPSREALRVATQQSAGAVRHDVSAMLKDAVVTVAADGWTNVKRQKVTNIVLMTNGKALYWTSLVNNGENTAVWLAQQLLSVIRTLIADHGARVVGVVVDNEAVNAAAHRLLLADLPFLVHIPCAAHTVQLIVRSCLELPQMKLIVEQLCMLIRYFDAKENRIKLRRIQIAREVKQLAVLKPCDTRWHALLMVAERMMLLHKEVKTCYEEKDLPEISATFFDLQLPQLISFLKPFLDATDAVQRDSATLYTVYEQFAALRQHADTHPWALPCINARWEKRIHVDAVTAVALLSFKELPGHLDRRAAQDYIVQFGCDYIAHYRLRGDEPMQNTSDALLDQIADFNGRSGLFAKIDAEIAAAKRAVAPLTYWQPLKIWRLYPGVQLAIVAVALLSITASEAAVERSFSAQALVHSKRRNALDSSSIEAEMMLKFNRKALSESCGSDGSGFNCIEMVEEATPEQEDAATLVPDAPDAEEKLMDNEEEVLEVASDSMEMESEAKEAESARPSGAAQRAMRRQASISFAKEEDFLQWFIQEHHLTPASKFSSDISNALERHSTKLVNSPGTRTLLLNLREALKPRS